MNKNINSIPDYLMKIPNIALYSITSIIFSFLLISVIDSHYWSFILFSIIIGVLGVWFTKIFFLTFILMTVLLNGPILAYISGADMSLGYGFLRVNSLSLSLFMACIGHLIFNINHLIKKIDEIKILKKVIILFSIFFGLIVLGTFFKRGVQGQPQCLENYLFPFIFFLNLLIYPKEEIYNFIKIHITIIVIIACYGILEYIMKDNFLFGYLYSLSFKSTWHQGFDSYKFRITTLIGHPLNNAFYFLFALPYSLVLFKKPFNLFASLILLLAIITTGSRAGFALALLCIFIMYASVTVIASKLMKNIILITVIGLIGYFFLFFTGLGETIRLRFLTEHHSTQVRIIAFQNLIPLALKNFIFGRGMGTSHESLGEIYGANFAFENPWLMLIIDIGFILTFIYFILLAIPMFKYLTNILNFSLEKAIWFSLFFTLLMATSYNSFGVRGDQNYSIWLNVSLLYIFSNYYEINHIKKIIEESSFREEKNIFPDK